jgi:hypothetical protein
MRRELIIVIKILQTSSVTPALLSWLFLFTNLVGSYAMRSWKLVPWGLGDPQVRGTAPHQILNIIVYNWIPKAGSTTIIILLKQQAKANGFKLSRPMPYYDRAQAR